MSAKTRGPWVSTMLANSTARAPLSRKRKTSSAERAPFVPIMGTSHGSEPAFADPVKTDGQRPLTADCSPGTKNRLLSFYVGHKAGKAPDHYQHIGAIGDGFFRECDDIFSLGSKFDREWQACRLPHLADVVADDLGSRNLPYGRRFAAVRRTEVQLDPAQA